MDLKIGSKVINEPIINILKQVRSELHNGKLKDIQQKGDNVLVTCPCHKQGRENHPSCQVYCGDSPDLEYGFSHCFTCGMNAPLPRFISDCFNESGNFGEEWLKERFGNVFVIQKNYLPAISLSRDVRKHFLDPEILKKYDFYHPYMWKRKLTKEIVDKFRIGYDSERDAITFPVWDEKNNLVMITERSVTSKNFFIPEDVDKPVYLLNFIKNENIKHVYVAESQINTLYLWSLGYPAIGLFGTGSSKQYDILKRSGIRSYTLCLDGDKAGRKGILRFIKNMPSDTFIDVMNLPEGFDVNDLSEDQIKSLRICDKYDWLEENKKLILVDN